MLNGFWGKKIGMTQVFSDENVIVPVTVIGLDNWFVTDIKTEERDGYNAVQVGNLRPKYRGQAFSKDWLKKTKNYFEMLREIKIETLPEEPFEIGQEIDAASLIESGQLVNVFGTTKGRGFQGVIKRHGFSGGSASHGPRFGRWPGSVGFMRSQGKVIKGKKLPGHMGVDRRVMKKLEVVKIEKEPKIVLVKGSVPGHAGSFVFIQKA
jgi:large subunit ribosomal protein L3